MIKKLLLVLALTSLLPFAASAPGYAADPLPADPGGTAADPADPNAAPYPPDGVVDPNATYPTDEGDSTDQGETGAAAPAVPPDAPPAGGNSPPD
jgi:hypothetical protein